MLAAGVDLKVTSDRLGHSSISIMADTYGHVISKLDREAAEDLTRLSAGEQSDKAAKGRSVANLTIGAARCLRE
jgi:integrase